MALCPDHGGYTGDTCKKCQTGAVKSTMDAIGTQSAAKGLTEEKAVELLRPPKLDAEDKFTLVKLENDQMKALQRVQMAQSQFQNFARTMFDKYGVKTSEFTLDMEKLEFVVRGM